MKRNRTTATPGLGPIVCIMMEGKNTGKTYEEDRNQQGIQPNDKDVYPANDPEHSIPEGEEQSMPNPEIYEERQDDLDIQEEDNIEEVPLEDPIPDIDEIEPDTDPQRTSMK